MRCRNLIETYWPGLDPATLASAAVRGMFTAAPGKTLFCSDFSSVEARVNAWEAGEESVLSAFREGKELYKVAADGIWNCGYENVTKPQRQVGKVSELALGYQGGIGAYASMAKGYGVDLEGLPAHVLPIATQEQTERAGFMAKRFLVYKPGEMSFEAAMACDVIKQRWREARPNIVRFWYALEAAAKAALQYPGQVFEAGVGAKLRFAVRDRWLWCRLPSGRSIRYFDPELKDTGDGRTEIRYWTVDGQTKQWIKAHTYAGKLCENAVQGIARDLLVEAMFRVEAAGYPIVIHVHDEIVSERDEGEGSLEEFNTLMAEVPSWAAGLPMAASGWTGKRYRKD